MPSPYVVCFALLCHTKLLLQDKDDKVQYYVHLQ